MATLRGEPVDRPAVCFYELNGLDENPDDDDPFNIFSHPSWRPLIELTRDKTDRIVMRGVPFRHRPPDPLAELTETDTRYDNGSRYVTRTLRAGGATFTTRTRRDPDTNTVWTLEHPLKGPDDLRAWLELPDRPFGGEPDVTGVLATEDALGETGIVMLGAADPLCSVAELFDMGTFTVVAMTEPALFRRALDKVAVARQQQVEAVAAALPGRLWRIVGPEYASPPYLPPELFADYVVRYDTPMVNAIHQHGGYARIHSHGRLSAILDHIAATGCVGLDPVEPPPQGDMSLRDVRARVGKQMVLFGNLEMSDIATLAPEQLAEKARTALAEGTTGQGRGFVLMPTACPLERNLPPAIVKNYETIIEAIERL